MTALLLAAIAGMGLAGCDRAPATPPRITAKDPDEYSTWQRKLRTSVTETEWERFSAAHSALSQFLAMPNDGRDAESTLRQMADGRTLEEFLQLGRWAKLRNLEALRHQLHDIATSNSMLVTKPDDDASARYLRRFQERETERLARVDQDIALLRDELAGSSHPGIELPPHRLSDDSPRPPASRAEVLGEIETLIRERRSWGMLKYGAWPVRIDRDGATLTGADHDRFQKLAAQAKRDDHTVVPVRIKGQWLYYTGATTAPTLPVAATALLTPNDLAGFADRWTLLEAELWARRTSQEEPP